MGPIYHSSQVLINTKYVDGWLTDDNPLLYYYYYLFGIIIYIELDLFQNQELNF